MVADMSDDEIWALSRGGHDPLKVYAAYHAAVNHTDQPTVILAKTVKGYGMGEAGEGQNITHQQKKMGETVLRDFRDRFRIDVPDEQIAEVPFLPARRPAARSRLPAGAPRGARRLACRPGGDRSSESPAGAAAVGLRGPAEGTGDAQISTTMAFVRILTTLLRDKQIGKRIVPIVPDESRTFGMEGLFRQFGIFSQVGQLYQPEDANQLMFYKEDKSGQLLQEGINEPGAMSSWIAAATSYSTNDVPMIPFYIYYSMFGFQRVGDLAWASGDMRARGFLIGGTAGRTTLNGEGLQHEDGHSHVMSATIPNCVSYDPTFSYEVAVIIADGLRRMYAEQEDVFYYLTVMNENYQHPALPEGREDEVRNGIVKGMYLFRERARPPRSRLRGCSCSAPGRSCARSSRPPTCWNRTGTWRPTCGACRASPSWDARRMAAERWNMLHPSGGAPAVLRGEPSSPGGRTGRLSPRPTTSGRSPNRSVRT